MYELKQNYKIEPLGSDYLDQVMEIEKESFITPWPIEIIKGETRKRKSYCVVSLDNETVNGFCISSLIFDELHILQVAVHSDYRRRGIGKYLLFDSFYYYRDKGAKSALLEVRVSNINAINLYFKVGFKILRVRKNYYRSNGEDAYVMGLDLTDYYQEGLSIK